MSIEFRLDISRCIGCRACEVACVTANDLAPERSRNWVPHLEADDSARARATFAPYLCHQCGSDDEEAPCIEACPTGASYKADDGRVLVDKELCIGCGLCVPACPYQARYVEPRTNKLEKCTLCEGRTKQGLAPACFDICPAGARHFFETTTVDGVQTEIRVGDPDSLDPGHEEIHLTTEDVDPSPRLRFSGLPEDLAILRQKLPPRPEPTGAGTIWRGGAGIAVTGLGVASAMAMGSMLGLRWLRDRKKAVADAEAETKAKAREPATPTAEDE